MSIISHTPTPVPEKKQKKAVHTDEDIGEIWLRPSRLDEYVGQENLKKHLKISIESAKVREKPLEHILFYGPPGLGKTTISMIVAEEMHTSIRHTSGPAIEKQADIVSLLTGLIEGEILFIDEIHRLRPPIEEILYGAMEDGKIDIMIWAGTGATSVRMDIVPFTLIGATTKLSSLSSPLRDRFGNICKLELYIQSELQHIAQRSLGILGYTWDIHTASLGISRRARGTPRIANRYAKILRDYAVVGHTLNTDSDIDTIFQTFGVDIYGYDMLDRKLLHILGDTYSGRAVGLSTLAQMIGEEVHTIEDVVEPYLLQSGMIERTARGRIITQKWLEYIGKSVIG